MPLSKPREGAARPAATNKNGPPQGPIKEICTHSVAHKPLNRGMPCPRWDSKCIPSPANAGIPRKHAESGPVWPQYDPSPKPKVWTMYTPQIGQFHGPGRSPTLAPSFAGRAR